MRTKKKVSVLFRDPGEVHLEYVSRALAGDAEGANRVFREDWDSLHKLASLYGIKESPAMWYELALELARMLYPAPQRAGRKITWTPERRGYLVVEIERKKNANRSAKSVHWACKALAREEPWSAFSPDVLRGMYHESKNSRSARYFRDYFESYKLNGKEDEWEQWAKNTVEKSVKKSN